MRSWRPAAPPFHTAAQSCGHLLSSLTSPPIAEVGRSHLRIDGVDEGREYGRRGRRRLRSLPGQAAHADPQGGRLVPDHGDDGGDAVGIVGPLQPPSPLPSGTGPAHSLLGDLERGRSSSLTPRMIVVRANPIARDTAARLPGPSATRQSAAATS